MKIEDIIVEFHDGERVVKGTIATRLTPRRLIARANDSTYKIILGRTNASLSNIEEGIGTITVLPRWERGGEDFPPENVFKFDDKRCWTVQGHTYLWADVDSKYIEENQSNN